MLLVGNVIVVDWKIFDLVLELDIIINYVDGGDFGSIVDIDIVGSVFILNGKVSMFL